MKIFSSYIIHCMYIINLILTTATSHTVVHKRKTRFAQKHKPVSQTMFLGELKKLNVRLLEEESIGREVANLQFLINRTATTISDNNHNQADSISEDKKIGKSNHHYYYQIFNSEPQSKYFHLDAQTGVLRVARRIDRDQLCPMFKSCCTYLSYTDYHADYADKHTQLNSAYSPTDNERVSNCHLDLNIRSDDQYTNIITVNVQIIDINDNAPTWLLNSKSGFLSFAEDSHKQDVMRVYVSESSLIGDAVHLTPAVDQDAGPNNIIKYVTEPQVPEFELEWTSLDRETSISNLQMSDHIQISSVPSFSHSVNRSPPGPRHELRLIVRSPLDRETKSVYEFNLTAVDGGSPSKNSTISLQVHVTDFNDNSPIFEKDTYIVDLRENARPHTPVVQVKATDIDEGSNAEIKYRISSLTKPEFMRLFALDSITGWIHVQWEVDYELYKKIVLTVEASDGGTLPRSTTCIVEITVLDENDHSPELHFEPPHLTNYALVPENEKPGRLVAVFTAQDKDSGDNGRVSCRLAESKKWHFDTQNKQKLENLLLNPTETLFSLQQMHMPFSIMYKLTTASSFDREFISKVTVWITCSDYGSPARSSTGSVAVRITDVNDESPVFSQTHYYFNVNENSEIGTIISRINATDPDEGENAKLTFWLSGPNSDYFEVNKITGHLTVQKSVDREVLNELRFLVHATDSGLPSLNASSDVTITVQDVNDNPPSVMDKIEFYVLENHTASLAIGKISAHDADIGRNADITYTLIQCIAYGIRSSNISVNVNQEPIPPFENYMSQRKNVSQSLEILYTPGTHIARLYAVDEDSAENGRITYGIKTNEHTNVEALFEVDPVTGNLILKRSVDYNSNSLKLREAENSKRLELARTQSAGNQGAEINVQNYSGQSKNNGTIKRTEPQNRRFENQMAYSIIVTVRDNGEPPLKSSTILRILFTPPFYPPNNNIETTNSLATKNLIWDQSSKNNLDSTQVRSVSHEHDYDYREPPIENELTGIGVLLGLVTAIGLFVCFLILVIMITFHQSRKLSEHRNQLFGRRRQVNSQHQLQQHTQQCQQHMQPTSIPVQVPSTHFVPSSILRHIRVGEFDKSEKHLSDMSRQFCIQTVNQVLPNSQTPLVTSFTTI
ncbi:unnamed protein product [Heterobilharzia americana]|nr:unnamed protein product [Heterobilharzia americana]